MKKIIILFLFIQLGFLNAQNQLTKQQLSKMETYAALINNKKLSCNKITDSLRGSNLYNTVLSNVNELRYLKGLFIKRFDPTLSDENLICYSLIELEGYSKTNQIGKALLVADKFYQNAKNKNDKKLLTRALDYYLGIYDKFDMPEERIKYARKLFYLNYKKGPIDKTGLQGEGGYAWNLTQIGWQLKNKTYMDSAAILLRTVLDYQNSHTFNFAEKAETYSVLLLTLARLKKHKEIIKIVPEAFNFLRSGKVEPSYERFRTEKYCTFTSRIGMAYCGLNNHDSAFYYLNQPIRFMDMIVPDATYYPKNKRYCRTGELMDIINAHSVFKEYKGETELLDIGLFSKDKFTDQYVYSFWYEKAAPIYEKAGNFEKAALCYRFSKKINDSLQSEKDKIFEEAQRINAHIQLQTAEETSNLEKEKIQLQAQNEREEKKIISSVSIIGAIILIIFLIFMYNRFRVARAQKNIIEQQKHIVEEKNMEITQSIEYALRIQTAILPPQKIVKQYLENSFILYKPKDIVAGDFYWMETFKDLIMFAACDCTGHGVPGAMVSVVCHNALNRAVREFGLIQPDEILNKTSEIVVENFSKSEENIKDGMDISLCVYNPKTKTLQWSGANNPLWIIQNGELLETKADKQPIGMNDNNKPFTNHTFILNNEETLYLFTDGFADQFGGATGQKKLTKKRFKDLILSIQSKTLLEQGLILNEFIEDYRKEVEQIDDILVMGIKV